MHKLVLLSLTVALLSLFFTQEANAAEETVYFEAEAMTLGANQTIISDSAANGGQAVRFSGQGTATFQTNFPENANEVRIKARAKLGEKWPIMAVRVDGVEVGRWTVRSDPGYTVYTAPISPEIASGPHTVSLVGVGQFAGNSRAFVDFVQFMRPDPPSANRIAHGAYANTRVSGANANPQWGDTRNIDDYTSVVGDRPELILGFQQPQDGVPVAEINNLFTKYPEFMLTIESGDLNLDQLHAGQGDADMDRIASALAQVNHRIYVRFLHEMNGNWYPYSTSAVSNGGSKYIDVFRRFSNKLDAAGANNVVLVWCPNVRGPIWDDPESYASLYPGDAYVDVMALDGYASFGNFTFDQVFDSSMDELEALPSTDPIWIAEWGVSSTAGYDKAAYFDGARQTLGSADYARLKLSAYFDSNQDGHNWHIDTSQAALDAYKRLVNDPAYSGTL